MTALKTIFIGTKTALTPDFQIGIDLSRVAVINHHISIHKWFGSKVFTLLLVLVKAKSKNKYSEHLNN